MSIEKAYNSWASQYDTNINATRDLEAHALRDTIAGINFEQCLEVGCGTGKNTAYLLERSAVITAMDISEEMLALAKAKVQSSDVNFLKADIKEDWPASEEYYDLVSFSLVLEHLEHLGPVMRKAARHLKAGGYLYIGELHPFKQYLGSKARFETEGGTQVIECYNHHLSDYTHAAINAGFRVVTINEYFDNDTRDIPRILAMLFQLQ